MKTKLFSYINFLVALLSLATATASAVGINDLKWACIEGNSTKIRQLITQGVNVNGRDDRGATPLDWAVSYGHVEAIKTLIQARANVNQNNNDNSYLHSIARQGLTEAIDIFLKAGIDINVINSSGETPLYLAAQEGHIEAIHALLKAGALVNVRKGTFGWTPLHIAGARGHVEAVNILLQAGADINIGRNTTNCESALSLAAEAMRIEVVNILLQHSINALFAKAAGKNDTQTLHMLISQSMDINNSNADGMTLLHWAAIYGHVEAITALIKVGANVNTRNKENKTALDLAEEKNHKEIIEILHKHSISTLVDSKNTDEQVLEATSPMSDINSLSEDGLTQLCQAARAGDLAKVKQLLSQGANIYALDAKGRPALYHAIAQGHIEIANFLKNYINSHLLIIAAKKGHIALVQSQLALGGNIATQDAQGRTALNQAIAKGHAAIAAYLIDHGADFSTLDFSDTTFLSSFLINTESDLRKLFKKILASQQNDDASESLNQAFLQATAHQGDNDALEFVLQRFKQTTKQQFTTVLAFQDAQGQTALHKAANNPNVKVMQILLAAYKANSRKSLSALDNEGESALHKAVRASNIVAIQLCDDYTLDFEQTNKAKQTLLHIAAQHSNLETLKFLLGACDEPLQQEINVEAIDINGQTALHLAIQNPDSQVFDYLAQNHQSLLHILDNAGQTVLHHAARVGNARLIELCNEYQLDFSARNHQGQTPLQIAQANNQPAEVIRAIQKAMQYNNTQQPSATPQPTVQALKLWSACQIGQTQANQNQTAQDTDDDDTSAWYFFGEPAPQDLPDHQNDHPQDDTDTPDAQFLLTPHFSELHKL